ncbi:hypothetical protein HMPREF1486_04309 [Streptomyces sp. HPH0547]|nr:hypothetical protein HMPREF1486_04309 [Streptomyces sp. HPH0547]
MGGAARVLRGGPRSVGLLSPTGRTTTDGAIGLRRDGSRRVGQSASCGRSVTAGLTTLDGTFRDG